MLVRDVYKDVKEILGQCSQEVAFRRLTEAVRLLANKGDWDPLIGYIDICGGSDHKTFTLPYDIETPLAVNICGRPVFMRNKWYEFHLNGMGSNHETPWTWDDRGFVPTIVDILNPSILVAICDLRNDLGAKLQISGKDASGRVIRSQNPDGTWSDGFTLRPNVLSDFPGSVIAPVDQRLFQRFFSAKPVTVFDTSTPHGFQSGVMVLLSLVDTPLPSPLKDQSNYYVGVISPTSVSLYNSRDDAIAGTNAIQLIDFAPTTVVDLMDKRQVQTQTKFHSSSRLKFINYSTVQFAATTLPEPITATEEFYLNILDANDFTIHQSQSDAQAGINPLFVTTPGSNITAKASQPITPYTKLVFAVPHNFQQNDQVTVANAGGDLPTPLLPGTNYYVRYISSTEITLHSTLTDASTGANAIILTDSGTGTSSVVKIISATANPGSTNNITANDHGLDQNGGDFVQFQSTGTLPTPLLAGTVYRAEPPASANTFTVAQTDIEYISTLDRRRSDNTAIITTNSPHGYVTGDTIDIAGLGGTGYNVTQVAITVVASDAFTYANIGADEGVVMTTSRVRTSEVATITTSAAHGLTTGDYANIQDVSGSDYNEDYVQVTVTGSTSFTYTSLGVNETLTTDNGGKVARGITDTGGNLANNRVNITSVGTGVLSLVISRAFTVGFYDEWFTDASNIKTGDEFMVNSTGAFPVTNPKLSPLTTYYARVEDDFTIEFFETQAKAEDAAIRNITSYARTSNVATLVSAAHGFSTGDYIDVSFMSDATFNAQRAQITVIDSSTFTYANTGANVSTTATGVGQATYSPIKITALGNGETDLILTATVMAELLSNLLEIDDASYLADGTVFQFTTDGTLPSPLMTATNYEITIVNGLVQIADDSGTIVVLTDIGSGDHFITRDFNATVDIPTDVQVLNNEYNNGDAVTASVDASGVLPSPISIGTTYYLRRTDDNSVELYDTVAHALNLSSQIGLVTALNSGSGTQYLNQLLPAIQIQTVDRVVIVPGQTPAQALIDSPGTPGIVPPPLRNGYIDLYAWDYGRANDLTMVGHYAPNENEPKYRRLRTQNSGAWIRMRYRRKTYEVQSMDDYIPLNSTLAIQMAVRAIDLYKTNFTDEGAKYEALAVKWMCEDYESTAGSESISIQINDAIFMDHQHDQMT